MCWYVYIATAKPIERLIWRENPEEGVPPLLHFSLIPEDDESRENGVRPLFEGSHLYYVGSSSGCSCHLHSDMEYDSVSGERLICKDPGRALIDFIHEFTQQETLEMYAVWEDSWNDGTATQPIAHQRIAASSLHEANPVDLVSRHFYRFY